MTNLWFNKRAGWKYRISFFVVTAFNLVLGAFLLDASFGQATDGTFPNQLPLIVEVVSQDNVPIRIADINVDNSMSSYQSVNLVLQNIGNQAIRAYVLFGDGNTNGKIITRSLVTDSLRVGESQTVAMQIERQTIIKDLVLRLSVDYAEFEDGSSWGSDSQGQSELIKGERAGRSAAIVKFKDLIKNNKMTELTEIFGLDVTEMNVLVPNSMQSEKWKRAYQRGYKGVAVILGNIRSQGTETLFNKLNEMEGIAKGPREQ